MGSISHLKGEVEKLSPSEQAEFRTWFLTRDNELWDSQIAADLQAGKLDQMIAEAIAERSSGQSREL